MVKPPKVSRGFEDTGGLGPNWISPHFASLLFLRAGLLMRARHHSGGCPQLGDPNDQFASKMSLMHIPMNASWHWESKREFATGHPPPCFSLRQKIGCRRGIHRSVWRNPLWLTAATAPPCRERTCPSSGPHLGRNSLNTAFLQDLGSASLREAGSWGRLSK